MIFSPKHRYNDARTKEVYKQAINNLCPGQIIKAQDFSENYTCLVPDEVQSLHWSRKQVTLFPVVTFRKDINDNLLEDQLVYVSNDKKHDCAFVKLVNAKIYEYYKQQGVKINLDIEFNDDCASQFKSIKSFWLFAKCKVHTERIYFESSHGKDPSDGLEGVVKTVLTSAECAEKLIIRNGKELHAFLEESCTLENDPEILRSKHCIMKRKFFLIEMDEINLFRKNLGKLPVKTHKGTQLLQIKCHRSITSYQLMLRKYACLCEPCLQLVGECENYASLDSFLVRKNVNLPLKNRHEQFDDDEDDEEFDEEHKVWEWENKEAIQMIQPNNVVVI